MSQCPLCDRVIQCQNKSYQYLIHEFKHSYFVLGEHQFYEGYSLLVAKDHYREMTDLPAVIQGEFFQEMMLASKVIEQTFKPTKMNMCSLGNVVPHLHWHFFPRYQTDPDFKNPPWLQMHLFDSAKISPAAAFPLIQKIRAQMELLGIG